MKTTTAKTISTAAAALGRKGGSAKSEAKTEAARANARLPRRRSAIGIGTAIRMARVLERRLGTSHVGTWMEVADILARIAAGSGTRRECADAILDEWEVTEELLPWMRASVLPEMLAV